MVPTNKTSKRRKRQRRAHDHLTARKGVTCPSCGSVKLPHAACNECGYVRPGLQLKFDKD